MTRLLVALAAISWPVVASHSCTSGITITGTNSISLDADYMMDCWPRDSFQDNWWIGPSVGFKNPYFLHYNGCFIPIEANYSVCRKTEDTAAVYRKWVIMQEYDGDGPRLFKIVAICTAGCPEGSSWQQNGAYDTKWRLTGEVGDAGTVTASASCCPRQAQTCDALHADKTQCSEHCSKYNGPLKVYNPACSLDECCDFDLQSPDLPQGECICAKKPPKTVCANPPTCPVCTCDSPTVWPFSGCDTSCGASCGNTCCCLKGVGNCGKNNAGTSDTIAV